MPSQSPPVTALPRPWGMVTLVFGLVLACYWPALGGGFIWDDSAHVTRPALRSLEGLGWIWTDVRETQQYYPILHSAFWLEQRVWGEAVLGYHLVNVLLHATSCCLLALFLRRLWRQSGVPAGTEWFAALLFAVHPVCVESVAWISEQKNTLSLVFYLLAALAYLDFADQRKPSAYARALVFFVLALGTKSVTATLPAALLVALWWRQGRLEWKRDIQPLVPWLVIGVGAGLFTAWVERHVLGADGAAYDLTLLQRGMLAGRVLWFYLGKLAWPAELMFIYPRWEVPATVGPWLGWPLAAIGLTLFLAWGARRNRGPLAGWLYFAGTLFPALGFFNVFPFVYSFVADHFQYAAMPGLLALAAAGGARLTSGTDLRMRRFAQGGGVVLIAGLAVLSHRQSGLYRDGETIYRDTLAKNPGCWMAHNNLANLLAEQRGREAEAEAHYRLALPTDPYRAEVSYNLAGLLARLPGREIESVAFYEEALRLQPDSALVHHHLATLLTRLPGREPEALAHYERAVALDPNLAAAHKNLANLLADVPGRQAEALAHYEAALRIDPDFAEAHNDLAALLALQPGRSAEVIAHYEKALRLKPDLADARINLASHLARQPGREPEAAQHLEQALRDNPNDAEAHYLLAAVLANLRRIDEAITHCDEALRIQPDYPAALQMRDDLRALKSRQATPSSP